jgi:aspartyl-tRNA(Asn)/glutamyl-tRNA(Gln) amidotransferase subunit B
MAKWETVVGLEIHAQVASESKLFSGAATAFGGEANSHVSLVDAALPGMLPVLNEACVRQAVRTGLALSAKINRVSVFERKHYFYPDLPPGYQISQYQHPIVGEGALFVDLDHSLSKIIRITRIHLEQDAGKSEHTHGSATYVDLNRAGVALMEIVTEPDMRSGTEAAAFVRKVRSIMRYLGTCHGNMEQGELRADVNVSVRRPGDELGTRCEIKNLNSLSAVRAAVESEARRQIQMLELGETVVQETRTFDVGTKRTHRLRVKEGVDEYRYFPDPDLPALRLTQDFIDSLRLGLPELPDRRIRRFIDDLGLAPADAARLGGEHELADYFETLLPGRDARAVARWMCGEFLWALNQSKTSVHAMPLSAADAGDLLDLLLSGQISAGMAKKALELGIASGRAPAAVAIESGGRQEDDAAVLAGHAKTILSARPDLVRAYKDGDDRLFGFFMGELMRSTRGRANPRVARTVLNATLQDTSVRGPIPT